MKLTPAQSEQVCWLVRKFLKEEKQVLVQGNSQFGYVALYEVTQRREKAVVFEGGETEWLPIQE